jgi:lipoprotein-releasing system permease protein
MYKVLLCWRYLRTRYIALASIISVMLGVATMIVVNSVMAGFAHEMQNRLHGILSDLVFESHGVGGFQDADWHIQEIRRLAGDQIEGLTPTVVVPAMLNFQVRGQWVTRQVNFIGIDETTHAGVSDFGRYLQHPRNRERLSFELYEAGYDQQDHDGGPDAPRRAQMEAAGWSHRRQRAEYEKAIRVEQSQIRRIPDVKPGGPVPLPQDAADESHDNSVAESASDPATVDPFAGTVNPFEARGAAPQGDEFDPAREQHTGVIGGIALFSYRDHDGRDRFLVLPGDDVRVTFPTAATPPQAVSGIFTVSDFYESKMSEYDSSFLFVPLRKLQEMRGMIDPTTGVANVTSIQIRLKPGVELDAVRDKLRAHFPPELYGVYTWRDKQGPLLAAVQMETAILNVLLFLIIAVAGFGILAIFFMIVVEKTRDIGILKSLGASGRGILSIFLGYGLSLGIVGSGVGLAMGLAFVYYINEIADLLGRVTGQPLFDPSIYYFQRIPTIVEPLTVGWIVVGAMLIAVIASILPARRAARLHPVEALRYE